MLKNKINKLFESQSFRTGFIMLPLLCAVGSIYFPAFIDINMAENGNILLNFFTISTLVTIVNSIILLYYIDKSKLNSK